MRSSRTKDFRKLFTGLPERVKDTAKKKLRNLEAKPIPSESRI